MDRSISGALKRIALASLATAAFLFSSPASAQMGGLGFPLPPDRITLDHNNVDVSSGAISLNFDEISIGTPPYGLALASAYNSSSAWSDSLTGVLQVHTFGEWNGDIAITASWGNQAWVFGASYGYSRGGDGAQLTYTENYEYVVTLRDGTVITYSSLTSGSETPCPGDGSTDCYWFYFATSVAYPNGLVVTPHYRVYLGSGGAWAVRIQSVTNNAGYQIKFNYQSNTVTNTTRGSFVTRTSVVALNNAVEYCDPDADTCSLSGNWPTTTYNNSIGTHSRTDPLGRTTQFTYSSATSFRIRTPGNTADNIQYTLSPYVLASGTVMRTTAANLGAGTWSYEYVVDSTVNPSLLTVTSKDPLLQPTVYVASRFSFPTNFFGIWTAWPVTSVKDPLNRVTSFSYPCVGGAADPAYLNSRSYKGTFPEQNSIAPVCDARGNVTSITAQAKPGSNQANLGTSSTFSTDCPNAKTCNQPSATVDARGAQTDYEYDPTHGGVTKVTSPAVEVCAPAGTPCSFVRPQKRYNYQQFSAYVKNSSGTLVAASGQVWLPTRVSECRTSAYTPPPATTACAAGAADEVVTTYEYGGVGTANRLLVRGSVVTWNGVALRTCYSYDQIGNRVSVTTPRAGLSACPEAPAAGAAFTTWSQYDAARQLVGVVHAPVPGGYEATRNTYDLEGRVTKVEQGYLAQPPATLPVSWPNFAILQVTDKTYDSVGRVRTEKHSSGSGANPVLTQYSYDGAGHLECTAVRMNPAIYNSLPSSACTLGTAGPDQQQDRITHLIYDAAGQLTVEQRAYLTSLQQNYASYGYTPNGKRDWVQDARGNLSDYTYDGFDRLKRLNFPQTTVGAGAANPNDYEQYGYDENGNRTSLRLRSNDSIGYTYDALNRLTFKDLPAGSDVAYRYDLQGHNTIARFGSSAGLGVGNIFDGFGRLTSSTSSASSGSLQLSYLYDADGNRTRVTWPDSNYVDYTYDGLDRMDQVRENGQSTGPGLLADYGYDMLSRRSNLARGNGTTTTYYPDGISRLDHLVHDLASTPSDVTFGFVYNQASQISQRTVSNDAYSYFSLPQSRSYTPNGLNRYDTVAGVTYQYDGRGNLTSDGSRGFTYDYENHLLTVSGSGAMTLDYDPLGRLQTTSAGGVTTRYLYDQDHLVGEYTGSTLSSRYVHGSDADEPLVWYEGAGLSERRWLHADHQGSVVASSNATGEGTVYAYGAYGEPAYDNWSGSRFRYTGQIMLSQPRLYHYKARVYDPRLGRFLQTDPVGYDADVNLYAYVGNDPLNKTDSSGKCPWCLVGAAISGGIQLAIEANAAGGISKIDGAAWQRIGLSAGAGLLGGGAATAIGRLAVAGTRIVASSLAGAAINTGQAAATAALQENRAPTASELATSAASGAAISAAGGVVAERIASTAGPAVIQVAKDASAAAKSLAGAINATTRSSFTQSDLNAASGARTVGEAISTTIDGVGNANTDPRGASTCDSSRSSSCTR